MKFIKEIFWSMKCGSYSGKGHKYTRKGDFESALACYQKALSYSDNEDGSAILIECIARSYARLEKFDMALSEAEKCLLLLKKIDSSALVVIKARNRVASLIEGLKKQRYRKKMI